jgi:hypothetical protein
MAWLPWHVAARVMMPAAMNLPQVEASLRSSDGTAKRSSPVGSGNGRRSQSTLTKAVTRFRAPFGGLLELLSFCFAPSPYVAFPVHALWD